MKENFSHPSFHKILRATQDLKEEEPLQKKISRILNFFLVIMATLLFGLTIYHHINQKLKAAAELSEA